MKVVATTAARILHSSSWRKSGQSLTWAFLIHLRGTRLDPVSLLLSVLLTVIIDIPHAPIVVHWAQLHRHKARLPPLTFAHSKFRHSRLRFFRRMHRWMYVTERYLTCLQMAKDEASRRGLDGSSLTFDDIISKPVNVPMSNWVNVHCHRH